MKKILSVVCCVSLFALTACGGSTAPSSNSSTVNPHFPDGTIEDLSEYDIVEFDREKYMLPIWNDGGIAYAETVMVVENSKGDIDPISLLYPAKQIVSVRSFGLDTLYKYGRDYTLTADGKLQIQVKGSIPVLEYERYRPKYDPVDSGQNKLLYGDRAEIMKEAVDGAKGITEWQIAVTYKHTAPFMGKVPAGQKEKFPLTNAAIVTGEMRIGCIGDSISQGWTASGFGEGASGWTTGDQYVDLAPNMPPYFDLVVSSAKANFSDAKIDCLNVARAGKTADWPICDEEGKKALKRLTDFDPHVIVLAFGMNDGVADCAMTYMDRMEANIKAIRNVCPNVEILLVSSMPPNEGIIGWTGEKMGKYHRQYPAVLSTLANRYKGITAIDMIELFDSVINVKAFRDLTSNNINHPNDYGHRLYAQAVYHTIFE